MLTSKQQKFVLEYVVDRNATQAAIRAGYAPLSAHVAACRLLKKDNVAHAVRQKEADTAAKLDQSREKTLQTLLDGIELARKNRNPAAMIEGAAQVARMLGYYAPAQVKTKVVVDSKEYQKQLARMSDAELRALLDEG